MNDFQHPCVDKDDLWWPPKTVNNNCRDFPTEMAGALTVSATGPIGFPGHETWLARHSTVGMSRVDVTAPGGDVCFACNHPPLPLDLVLTAMPTESVKFKHCSVLEKAISPLFTAIDEEGARMGERGTEGVTANPTK